MKAEILAVGTEILLGDIVNTNAQYVAQQLAALGITVYRHTAVGDNPKRLLKAYAECFARCDLVIATGGLGPTADDITKEVGAELFGRTLITHAATLNRLESFFKNRQHTMTENNKKQAEVPQGAIVLENAHGTAPGIIIEGSGELQGKILIMLPGPPMECIPMFDTSVKPYLNRMRDTVFESRVLRLCGIGESAAEDKIKDLIAAQSNPTIALYAKTGEVHIRLTASAQSECEAYSIIAPVADELYSRFGLDIYGEDDTSLEGAVAKRLCARKLTISTAESCTGGMLAARLINYPGISSVFAEGAVTYSNEAKMRTLGVNTDTLDIHGAVSHETAAEMARGIAERAGTLIGVSTTGVAGPGGGSLDKPVGLVYIGLYVNGTVQTKELRLSGDRAAVRRRTVISALDWIRRNI